MKSADGHGTTEWALLLVIGAHVAAAIAHKFVFPRPDHTADATGDADGRADREPEARGRSDEARPAIAGRLMIRVAEPRARSDLA